MKRVPARASAPVIDPAGWGAEEFREAPPFVRRWSDDDIADMLAATRRFAASGKALVDIERSDFPLGPAARTIAALRDELTDGVGIVQMRGLPIAELGLGEAAIALLGIGAHFGALRSQNAAGHILGHVKDIGLSYDDPLARGYQTAAELGFHTDPCDFVALLCLRTAREGGESRIVSSVGLHNEMLKRRPDLAAVLAEDFYWTRHGEVPPGKEPWYRMPVFAFVDGYFSGRGISTHILKSQGLPGVPRFTEAQKEAIALFRALAQELAVDVPFREGDFQILCNHVMLHSRRPFDDWPEQKDKRHLLRLWISDPTCRPVPQSVRDEFEGIEVAGFERKAPLAAELA